jgi:hypothetical protein
VAGGSWFGRVRLGSLLALRRKHDLPIRTSVAYTGCQTQEVTAPPRPVDKKEYSRALSRSEGGGESLGGCVSSTCHRSGGPNAWPRVFRSQGMALPLLR